MGLFVDRKSVALVLLAIAVVVALCALDLHCAAAKDDRARRESALPRTGALAHVKDELAAGRQAWNQLRDDQLNEQLRMLRVLAKRCAEKGENTRARATIALIQEIEAEKRARSQRSSSPH